MIRSFIPCLVVVATMGCSDPVSPTAADGGSPAGGDPCKLAAGRYQVVYTSAGGACSAPGPSTFDYDGGDLSADARANSDCKVTENAATCTISYRCTTYMAGYKNESYYSFSTKTLRGSSSTSSTPMSGSGYSTSCSLTFEWRKL